MATYADVDAFFARWSGRSVDRDGKYGAQCVDFAAQYTSEISGVGFLPTLVTGGARDIYEQFSLGAYFDRIPNTLDFIPKKGDVGVFTKPYGKLVDAVGNTYYMGHICVCTGDGNTNWFDSYDQNWDAQVVKRIRHDYRYFLGVLRPKNLTAAQPQGEAMINSEQVKDLYRVLLGREADLGGIQTYTGKPWDQVFYAIKDSPEAQGHAKAQAKALQDMKDQIASQQAQIDKLNAQIKELGSKPVTEDQAAQVVADTVKPSVSFIQKVINLLRGKK